MHRLARETIQLDSMLQFTIGTVLFGGLQKTTSEQLGLSPILMGAANSSGGVMDKMIDAQSIVVASTATGWFGHEAKFCAMCSFTPLRWRA